MKLKVLDYLLVPIGFIVLVAYHLWLLRQIIKHPKKTVIGIHAINRRYWVRTMMEDNKNAVLAVQTLRNNIMASTLLALTAIMMSSCIAVLLVLVSGGGYDGSGFFSFFVGDKSPLGYSIKFFCILVCFLLAFLLTMQSIRYYSHASYLVNVPSKKLLSPCLTEDYVAGIVNRGGYFWSMGLRALYFFIPLFMWTFGPASMLVCCFSLVFLLYFLDTTSEFDLHIDTHTFSCNSEDIHQHI